MAKFFLIVVTILYFLGLGCPTRAEVLPTEEPDAPGAKKVITLGNFTMLGSYSKVCGGNNLSGIYVSTYIAPALKLNPQDYLIPLYNGLYKRQRQIINEEEGGRLYTTVMSHNFSLMHKHLYSDLLAQRVSGLLSLNYNKETSDESFGDGLYDYRDYGLVCDYQYNLIKTEADSGILLFGAKYYFRKYPNYKTLISLSSNTAPEEDEKDQNVWGSLLRYTYKSTDKLAFALSYDFLFKRFVDKLTIDSNGFLEDTNRKDNVQLFKLHTDYRPNKSFILGLDAEVELNNSNQNYYDTMDTPALGNDVFVPHYFNYNKYEIKPALTYLFPLEENKNIAFKLAYAYTLRDYPNRNVKNAQGTYQSDTQEDRIHAGFLNITFPLTRKLSFLINADYAHTTSNMEYERYYRYDYDLYHILSGLSYKF